MRGFQLEGQRTHFLLNLLAWFALAVPLWADERDRLPVGVQADGRILVPTNQILQPAGKQVTFPGRPVDLALTSDGNILVVKNRTDWVFIDWKSGKLMQTLALPIKKGEPRVGFSVVGVLVQGDRILASDAQNAVRVAQRWPDGRYGWADPVPIEKPAGGGFPYPSGMAQLSSKQFWVASSRGNSVVLADAQTGLIEQIVPVGVAPYAICCIGPDHCYVSNWGGDPPRPGDRHAHSSGSPIRIDPESAVANDGTVSVLGKVEGRWKQIKTIQVGLHPSGLALSPRARFLYVANANSDSVSVIDTRANLVVETIPCRPEVRLPFGSGTNALAVSPDGRMLFAANGTNNCIAVITLGANACESVAPGGPPQSHITGLIPTGWYPGALLLSPDGKKLFVANVKGHGSLWPRNPLQRGRNSHDHLGSVSIIDLSEGLANLARHTQDVNRNNRLAYSLAGLEKPRPGFRPVPVPERHGEPSVFEHVIYIIKENRTYDQVFGDIKEGNGDPRLVMFGEDVTPNQHALARQFTLFDNFYCSGVLSADGHSWVNEAYVTDYLEKAFGGFTRSYPDDGRDPLAYPSSGFLWDNALAHDKTFRNYGEFVNENFAPPGTTWTDIYNDYKDGTSKVRVTVRANLHTLAPYTHPRYPWFPLLAPDVYRAAVFLEEFRVYEKKGEFPNLVYVTLPCNHTEGTNPGFPTPRAMVADNDLALGRIVEAVTKSRFWPRTCILVVEDDPQNGFDHVDGHRSVALAISPYTRRRFVDHTNYNQTGMVKTIELMLGLPPMNQLDLAATPMRACFQETLDLSPYTGLPNRIPLDEMNPPLQNLRGQALFWAKKSLALDFKEGDKADEDTLNRILWHATRGDDTPYPQQFVGSRFDEHKDKD
jgi:YVTN family beta-propeller protein